MARAATWATVATRISGARSVAAPFTEQGFRTMQAGLDRRVHDPGQQPVGLGDGVGRDRFALQAGQPGPDRHQIQVGQRRVGEGWQQEPAQQVAVQRPGVGPQVRGRVLPAARPLGERHPASAWVGPLAPSQVRLDLGQEPGRLRPGGEGLRRRVRTCRPRRDSGPASGRTGAAAPNRRTADPCAAPSQLTLRRAGDAARRETGRRRGRAATDEGRTSTRRAAMNMSISVGSSRTCRPTLT